MGNAYCCQAAPHMPSDCVPHLPCTCKHLAAVMPRYCSQHDMDIGMRAYWEACTYVSSWPLGYGCALEDDIGLLVLVVTKPHQDDVALQCAQNLTATTRAGPRQMCQGEQRAACSPC